MRYLTLQTVTWTTVAAAVASAVWLAAAGATVPPAGGTGERVACGTEACTEACTVLAARVPSAQVPASGRSR
jgi:hypothetical protein